MNTSIIIAGSGGQGILLLGRLLAISAAFEGRDVTWFPSYGAEMRGGTAICTVIISDRLIGSPVVYNPDILIAMNRVSLEKYQMRLKKNGLLIYDSSLVSWTTFRPDIKTVSVPAADLASSLSAKKSANMIILGALLAKTGLIEKKSVKHIFGCADDIMKRITSKIDINTIYKGYDYIEDKKSRSQGR